MSDSGATNADADVRFLENLQLVLAESRTSSTYKYALLLALADICIEDAFIDDRAELPISVTRLAEKFLEIYWRHGLPYGAGIHDAGGGVLSQNRGKQASVIQQANDLRAKFGSPAAARRQGPWQQTVATVARQLQEMPLWRLQRLHTTTLDFLYPEERGRGTITLRPGVCAAFRRFHALIVRLVQAEWMAFLYSLPGNQLILGSSGDLADFLFGPQRESLLKARSALTDVQDGNCFYCRRPLRDRLIEVDHFIPWSRYPRNLVHNLVVADRQCNAAKSDVLAGEAHRLRWLAHARANDQALTDIGAAAGLPADLSAAIHIADWCYTEAQRIGANIWIDGSTYQRLGTG